MKKEDVRIDGTYLAKVNGGVVPVRITGEKWTGDKHTGWVGVNTRTNRSVRIKSAQRLRGEVQGQGGGEAPAQQEDAAAAATTPHGGGGVVTALAGSPRLPSGTGAKRGAKGGKSAAAKKAAAKGPAANTTKVAKTPKATAAAPQPAKAPKEPKPAKPKRVSALDAAAQVLAAAGTPMKPKEMIALMEAKGLWTSPGGKTPEATLYAAIIREISAKGKEARFRKTDRGTFVGTGAGAGEAA